MISIMPVAGERDIGKSQSEHAEMQLQPPVDRLQSAVGG